MANATAKAESATVPFDSKIVKRNLVVSAATYYPGTMIGLNAAGSAVKCDDSAVIQFDGLQADSFRITLDGTETLGDRVVNVEKPRFFIMKIAAAAVTDVGRAVYAKYDNEVAYSGLTYHNLVGHVVAYISATEVLIEPVYAPLRGAVTQATNRSTGVTLSTLAGTITTDTTSLAAGAGAEFTVTNTKVTAGDVVVLSLVSGNTGVATCVPFVSAVADGSFKITITNQHASTAEVGACVINFAVIKCGSHS